MTFTFALRYIALRYIALRYIALRYTTLHYATLCYYCASKTEPRPRGRQDTSKPKIDRARRLMFGLASLSIRTGKPEGFMTGADGKPIEGCLAAATLTDAYLAADKNTLLLGMTFDPKLHVDFGAPAMAWMRLEFDPEALGEVQASLTLVNKTATRLPEAMWVTNTPVGSGAGNWSMDKLGGAVSPLDVATGASRGLHNILTGE